MTEYTEPEQPAAEEEQTEQETALLPKSIFQKDVKVGSECTFKVLHIYDDEVEVEYSHSDKKKPEEDGDAMAETMGEMDRMSEA